MISKWPLVTGSKEPGYSPIFFFHTHYSTSFFLTFVTETTFSDCSVFNKVTP